LRRTSRVSFFFWGAAIIRTTIHIHTFVILLRILAHAADLQSIKRQYQADQETQKILADYPIPVDLASEYAEKQQYFEVCTFIRRLLHCKFLNPLFKKGRIRVGSGQSCL
jgi:hypothetical protein